MKHHILAISAVFLLLFPSCGEEEQPKELQSLMEASRNELASALEERDMLLDIVKKVAAAMEQARSAEDSLYMAVPVSGELDSRVVSDVMSVCSTLQKRREQLAVLEARFQESVMHSEEMKAAVTFLHRQIDCYAEETALLHAQLMAANGRIEALGHEVDSLNMAVAGISASLDAANRSSATFERGLNTCYYAVTTRAVLREHGVIRNMRLLKNDFDKGIFTAGDKRTLLTIELPGKARIRTSHPDGSYEVTGKGRHRTLHILDPEKFWCPGNYLVVQID